MAGALGLDFDARTGAARQCVLGVLQQIVYHLAQLCRIAHDSRQPGLQRGLHQGAGMLI